MRFVVVGLLLVAAGVGGGCNKIKPAQAKAAVDKLLKAKPVPKSAVPPLQSVHPPKAPTNPLLPPGSVASTFSAQVSHSKAVGSHLAGLRPRIPPQVFARLWQDWQTNDQGLEQSLAEIRFLEGQCTCHSTWCKNCAKRKSLERRHQELAARNIEIESLLSQYG